MRSGVECGVWKENLFTDGDAESLHDLLEALVARGGVEFGFVALNLLFLEAEPFGKGSLAQRGSDPGLDQT